jgi:hypothetical protein
MKKLKKFSGTIKYSTYKISKKNLKKGRIFCKILVTFHLHPSQATKAEDLRQYVRPG